MEKLSKEEIRQFQRKILRYYQKHGREFIWRKTEDPYRIFVSEIILQQTQAGGRTEEKFRAFIKKFPTIASLAKSPLSEVLGVWQGLGYNRRAKYIKEAARKIEENFSGKIPKKIEDLESLPGVGAYTARAIATFAFGEPHIFLETNIRSVYIHEYYPKRKQIDDHALLPLLKQTLYVKNPREWYFALMDYGSMLKKKHPGIGRRSKTYVRQSAFRGSDREIRGEIIKYLITKGPQAESKIISDLSFESGRVRAQIKNLSAEGILKQKEGRIALP